MFNMSDLGNMTKLAGEAKKMQQQQDTKHQEQITILSRIESTLNQILGELKKNNQTSQEDYLERAKDKIHQDT